MVLSPAAYTFKIGDATWSSGCNLGGWEFEEQVRLGEPVALQHNNVSHNLGLDLSGEIGEARYRFDLDVAQPLRPRLTVRRCAM